MQLGFTVVSARQKKRDDDAEAVARVESMRPERRGEQRRNPSTDQKRERRRMQRKVAAEMVRDHELAPLEAEWQAAFEALKAAGLEHDADHPIAQRYRDASNAVNYAHRSRDFAIMTGQPTALRHSSISDDEFAFIAYNDAEESQASNERRNFNEGQPTGPDCPDCGGTGQTPTIYGNYDTCPTCGGSGIDPGTGMTGGDPRLARRTAADIDFERSQQAGHTIDTGGQQVYVCPYCDTTGTAPEMEQHLTEAGPEHSARGTVTDQMNARIPGGLAARKTAAHSTEGPYKVQVAGNGENVWSENAIRHQTEEEAKAYASDLLSRWMGADMARVVPSDTPNREPVDPSDPRITHNYRTGSRRLASTPQGLVLDLRKHAARSCDSCGSDDNVTADRTLGKDLCQGCKTVLRRRRSTTSTESSLSVTAFTVKHAFVQSPGGKCASCGHPDQPLHPRTAVNESGEGAARYQRTPDPAKPSWINDEYDDRNKAPRDAGAADSGNGAYPDWEDRGDLLDAIEERRRRQIEADEGLVGPGWDEKVTAKGSRMTTESDLLRVMADARRPMAERQAASAELEALRMRRSASVRADRETDLAASIVEAHLTPTLGGQSLHTTATNWVAEADVPDFTPEAEQMVRAEAALWFSNLHEAVVEDAEEFGEQALGMARRTAGRYGEVAEIAAQAFIDHAEGLRRREARQFPTDPGWADRYLRNNRYEVPEEARDPQRPGATNEQGASAEHEDEVAFDAERPPGDHKHHPLGAGEKAASRRTAGWETGTCTKCGKTIADSQQEGEPGAKPLCPEHLAEYRKQKSSGLVAYVPAFAQVEARTGVQMPREARPFIAALGAICTQADVIGGVTAAQVVEYAVKTAAGWGGAEGTNLLARLQADFAALPKTAGDQPPWLNGGDDDSKDDDDSKSDDDDKDDSKDDDKSDDDDDDDDDKKSDDDDDKKEASLLGSTVTAQFRARVAEAIARGL